MGYGLEQPTPDHVTVSRTRRLTDAATHEQVFGWHTIGVDATTLEANAVMRSIVRRDTGESYPEYLQRLAAAEGMPGADAAALRRVDRRRRKQASNIEWVNPHEPEAEITRLKDGRAALAYKVEEAADMASGAVLGPRKGRSGPPIAAVCVQPGRAVDPTGPNSSAYLRHGLLGTMRAQIREEKEESDSACSRRRSPEIPAKS